MIIICNLQRIIDYCEEQASVYISSILLGEKVEGECKDTQYYAIAQHRLEAMLLTIRRGHGFLLRI